MPSGHKLLAPLGGIPLVRHTVLAALASRVCSVTVVTGHEADAVSGALQGLPVTLVHNADHESGMASSLRVGLAAVVPEEAGLVVLLADMPLIRAEHIDALVERFQAEAGRTIVVPVCAGRRGNPVLWPGQFRSQLMVLSGDTGARKLLGTYAGQVSEVVLEDEAIFMDVDTAADLAAVRAIAGDERSGPG